MSKLTMHELFEAPAPKLEALPLEEELELIARAQDGDEAAHNALLRQYIPALRGAVSAQYKRLRDTHDLDEVRSLVFLAFVEGVKTVDAGKRLAGNFAGRVKHAVHNDALPPSAVSVPPRTYSRFVQIIEAAGGDPRKAEELAPGMGMTVEVLRSIRDARGMWGSLDELTGASDEAGRITVGGQSAEGSLDVIARSAYHYEAGYASTEARHTVELAFAAIDEQARAIVRLAYGFADYEALPDAEVGHRLGFTRSKVQRVRMVSLEVMHDAVCSGHDEGRCNRDERHEES